MTLLRSTGLYITFWNLTVYDISVPTKLYESLRRRVDAVQREDLLSVADSRERERYTMILKERSLSLNKELQQHESSSAATTARLRRESAYWISMSD